MPLGHTRPEARSALALPRAGFALAILRGLLHARVQELHAAGNVLQCIPRRLSELAQWSEQEMAHSRVAPLCSGMHQDARRGRTTGC